MIITGRVPLPRQVTEVSLKELSGSQWAPSGWWSSWHLFYRKVGNPRQGNDASGILQEAFWMSDLDCIAISCLIRPKLVEERAGH